MSTVPAIAVERLCKEFRGKKRAKVLALQELSFAVEAGEVFGFLGPNGAGKSTLIKILMGLIFATGGSATLNGMSVHRAEARRTVGYLPENPAFYDFLSAHEYLHLVGGAYGMTSTAIAGQSDRVLAQVDLLEASKRPIRSFSKGMVQRLGLAQALLHDPQLYILDEPMSGLDPLGRALVKEIIRDLRARGKTVFFSTHITADVEALCDRVGILVKGRLEALDEVETLLQGGILGYSVHVRGLAAEAVPGCPAREISPGLLEFAVPRELLNEALARIDRQRGTVELIETRRKDLEQFFLEVVGQRHDSSG